MLGETWNFGGRLLTTGTVRLVFTLGTVYRLLTLGTVRPAFDSGYGGSSWDLEFIRATVGLSGPYVVACWVRLGNLFEFD